MLKCAVIGLGNMGRHHARVLNEIAELVAVCDADIACAQEFGKKYNCSAYSDYHEILARDDITVVVLAVPTSLHESLGLDILASGKHLFVEKPMASTLAGAKRLLIAAQDAGVQLMVGHIERFNPAIIKLKELIDTGVLGNLTCLSAKRVGIAPPQVTDANVLLDIGIHDIDILNYLTGRLPSNVYSLQESALTATREDYAQVLLDYNGIHGSVQVNWITPVKIRTLSVTGTKGHAELDYVTQSLKLFKSVYTRDWDGHADFVVKFGASAAEEVVVEKGEPLKLELQSFLDAVASGAKPGMSGEEALAALKIVKELL